MEFKGSTEYVLDDELAEIINITMALEMPLLLKGTGHGQDNACPCHFPGP